MSSPAPRFVRYRRPIPPMMEGIASRARRTGVSEVTVRRQVLRGRLGAVQIGGSWRIPLPEAEPWSLPEYCTVRQVANALEASEVTVRRWIAAGELPATKTGRIWLVPRAALAALVSRAGPSAPPSDARFGA